MEKGQGKEIGGQVTIDPIVSSVFAVVVGLLFSIIGWTMNRLFQRIDKLEDAHTRFEIDISKHFFSKDEIKEWRNELQERLIKLDENLQHLSKRLERKAAGRQGHPGERGDQGDQGERGKQGDQGEQGVPGKYLWIQKEGTEDAGGGK